MSGARRLEVLRLDLGAIDTTEDFFGLDMPVHAYAFVHPVGVVLVDTGMGTLDQPYFPSIWTSRPRSVADGLADHGLSADDVTCIIQTHLHSDHYGDNRAFAGRPIYVQRAELERARAEERLRERFDFEGARFETIEGDTEVLPNVHALFTPGHTSGHQSVLVEGDEPALIVGDAVYTAALWESTSGMTDEMRRLGIRGSQEEWQASLDRLRGLQNRVVHVYFSHDRFVVAGGSQTGRPTPAPSAR